MEESGFFKVYLGDKSCYEHWEVASQDLGLECGGCPGPWQVAEQ